MSSVAKSAGRMGLATLCSRILGLAREQVFAFLFGASHAADAFNIAFRIPNLLRDLFAEGAMSAAFVPNFTKALVTNSDNKKQAFRLLAGVLSVLILIVGVISILGMTLSTPLVELYASAYKGVPGKFELSVSLTRVMFPFFPFVAMAAVLMGALNAMGHFFLPAFAPVLFNVGSIFCGLVICPLLARYTSVPPIYGMAIGVVLGGFMQFYIQWWQVKKEGFRALEFKEEILKPLKVDGVKRVLWLLIPGTVGLAATQLGILINSIYATGAGAGAVSWLNYSFRLMQFPIGIFGVSLAAATLPLISRRLAEGDQASASNDLTSSLKMSFCVNGPAAAGLMIVGLPIVQLLFQHGAFTQNDAEQTAQAVFWYALGLPAYSMVKILVPIYYALGNTRTPVILSFASVGLNAALNHFLLEVLHFPFWSLAAATSASTTLNAVFLMIILTFKLSGFRIRPVLGSFLLHGIVSSAVAAASLAGIKLVQGYGGALKEFSQFLFWSFEVIFAIGLALGIWLSLGSLFKIPENSKVLQFLLKKFKRAG